MHQCGLPLPMDEHSELPLFEDILADIGDEQSISQNLSTFSAHLKSIGNILKIARKRKSLVLLDELGSGTDPVEGGALGNAILKNLQQSESLTLSHYAYWCYQSFCSGTGRHDERRRSF